MWQPWLEVMVINIGKYWETSKKGQSMMDMQVGFHDVLCMYWKNQSIHCAWLFSDNDPDVKVIEKWKTNIN